MKNVLPKYVVCLAALSTAGQATAHQSSTTGPAHLLEHAAATALVPSALFLIVLLIAIKRFRLF